MRYFKSFGIVVLGIILFGFSSCQKEPTAGFSADKTAVLTDEVIQFTNTSTDGDSYLWDFGDGETSIDLSPTHSYSTPGTFTVELTAFSKNGKKTSSATLSITVTQETLLKLTAYINGTTTPVDSCTMTLYTSEDDWENLTNDVGSGMTDSNGEIIFTNVQPITYYIDAYKETSTGYWSNDDLGYVVDVKAHKINNYIIYVEFTNDDKSSKAKIIKIKRMSTKKFLVHK